jgi:epoxyqueuosine reductase
MTVSIDDRSLEAFDALVRASGFFAWGSARAAEVAEWSRYEQYLASGRHASMRYLARHAELRRDPRRLMPGAASVLVFLRSYAWPAPPVPARHGGVAAYARGLDYHDSLRRDLAVLAGSLGGFQTRAFVDTGPVLERYWARTAGIAQLGKNTTCLRAGAGSLFVIGVILTDALFPPGPAGEADPCGPCERCLEACPTGALESPYQLDARRCLSFLTIENRNDIPPAAGESLGAVVFGCDRCQDACPHNREITVPGHEDLRPRPPFAAPSLADLLAWSGDVFDALAAGRAVARATHPGMQRNALFVAARQGATGLIERFAASTADLRLRTLAERLLRVPPGGTEPPADKGFR